MVVQYGSTVLVPGAQLGIIGMRLNGEQLVDQAQFFRAIAASYFSRGNKTSRFEFDVWWYFSTRGAAENFILGHWASLAATDTLTVTCGDGEATQYIYALAGAVLQSVAPSEWRGISVKMHYVFVGGLFATQSIQPPNEDTLIKRGTVILSSGQASQTVSFAASFPGVPVVIVRVNRPSNAVDTVVDWDAPEAQVTAAGFVAQGQATPGAGYTLNWLAISP